MAGVQPNGGVPPSQTLNALSNPPLAAGCENLWHSIRCNPKFDPVAANAVISEILNVVAACREGTGSEYDCNRLDNLARAVSCIAAQTLFDCLEDELPDASDACTIEQLVQITDSSGCRRIGRYTNSSASLGLASACSVIETGSTSTRPTDPNDTNTFYTATELFTDIQNNAVNEVKLAQTILVEYTFTLECAGAVELQEQFSTVFNPGANAGGGTRSWVVTRVDGDFLTTPDGLAGPLEFTNFVPQVGRTRTLQFSAGMHTIQYYVVAHSNARPPAQVSLVCSATGGSGTTVRGFRAIS